MTRRSSRLLSLLLVLALIVVVGWYVVLRPKPQLHIVAELPSADGIFVGSRVALLGVPAGQVEEVQPQGATVRVTMGLPGDTRIPLDAHAYVMNPDVVSDRFIELAPVHTTGPVLSDGDVIPVERTHSPVRWSELTQSLDELLTAFGPQSSGVDAGIDELLSIAADSLVGNGQELRDAVTGITQASDLVATNSGDVEAVLDNVDQLLGLLADHRSVVDSLVTTVSAVSDDFAGQQAAVTQSIDQLSHALGTFSRMLDEHGEELADDLSQLTDLTTNVVAHQRELAETLDTMPLTLGNFARAVTDDDRLRIRLNISTTLAQFAPTAELCERFPVPLCSGAGLTNPIDFPPDVPDALGLDAALQGSG